MSPADEVRLQHMLEAAEKVTAFTQGCTRQDLDTDEKLSLAVVRLLEICGEAAKAVSAPLKASNPLIPWSAIGRTRDRLIHGYFSVDLDIVWQIVVGDIPLLTSELKQLLGKH
jgi:uncharacterized protein with HEPN domain